MALLRVARSEDAPELARIYVASWNAGFVGLLPSRAVTDDLVARWARDLAAPAPQRWWVAEENGVIIGFVGIGPSRDPIDPTWGELDTIAVDPLHWRQGIGRALMEQAHWFLRADGYQHAILWTLAHYPAGQAFYRAMGWRPDGVIRDSGRQVRFGWRSR